jgi:hypothetical protein
MLPPDLSLDALMRGDLNVWSNRWFWVLVVSTIIVGIGIICEAPELFQTIGFGHETIGRIRRFWYIRIRKIDLNGWEQLCSELITRPRHHGKMVAIMGFIGWTLVALGVVGEGLAEYFVNDAETDIRAFDEGALIETQRSANSASDAASLANDFAKKAELTSAKAIAQSRRAQHEADSFERDIVSAKKQAADAESSHLADALQRAANAERETAELKARAAPRRLDLKQQASISSKLSLFPNEHVDLTWYPDSFEAGVFAADIEKALTLPIAHWHVNNRAEQAGTNGMPSVSGVLIMTMPTDRSQLAGAQLAQALAAEKVAVSISPITAFFPSFSIAITDRKSLDEYNTRLLIVVGNHP